MCYQCNDNHKYKKPLTKKESFDGIHPKLITFGGVQFGYHKSPGQCKHCGNYSHFSLHRRYKWTPNFEKFATQIEDKLHITVPTYNWRSKLPDADTTRLWICSDDCIKQIMFQGMFELAIPANVALKGLGKD